MKIFLLASLLAAPAWCAGPDLKGQDQVSDPALLKELKTAEKSNEAAAAARGSSDAERAAETILVLLDNSRGHLVASLAESRETEAQGIDDPLDALVLAAQMLEAKRKAFHAALSSASLRTAELTSTEAGLRRAGYRERDRRADLARSEAQFKKSSAGKEPALPSADARLMGAFQAALIEHKKAAADLNALQEAVRKEDSGLARRLRQRAAALESDRKDLEREGRLLELALLMRSLDADSFDQSH